MISIGVRELRQQASKFLRRVERGETIQVTDRGRPVALLTPVPGGTAWEQLVAAGEVARSEGDVEELGPPLPSSVAELPSTVLARLRAHER